ncbi:MAG: helix-turn-helix domain-containing protein [Actinomycetota bacterium]
MVDPGPSIQEVPFVSRATSAPVELLERTELLARFRPEHFAAPQRPTFRLLVLVAGRGGTHSVDFDPVPMRPGRLIYVRPGQVQSWDHTTPTEAAIVVAQAWVGDDTGWFPGDDAFVDLDDADLDAATALIDVLRAEQRRIDGGAASARLVTSLFTGLEAIFHRSAGPAGATATPEPYAAFRRAIESAIADGPPPHNVSDLVADLPYAGRTIVRATRHATGRTPKEVLDHRLVLEADRLLAHTALSCSAIGASLGFREATNFHKFYVRLTGRLPTALRRERGPISAP